MSNVIELNQSNWDKEVGRSGVPMVVDFFSPTCDLSRQVEPRLENLAVKYAGRARVGKVNIQENPDLAKKYEVTRTPRVVYFNQGSTKAIHQLVGVISESDLAKLLNYVLGVVE